jgi:hypothetical protein
MMKKAPDVNEIRMKHGDDAVLQAFDAAVMHHQTGNIPALDANLEHVVLSLDDWLRRDLPEPDPILGHWLTTTTRGMLTAPTGLGKTMFGIGACTALSAGMPFLRWQGRRPCNVLYVDGEMSRRLMKRRLTDEIERSGLRPKGLHVLSHDDVENFQPLNTEAGRNAIEAIIARIGKLDLLWLDNIMSLVSGDMKEEEGWRRTIPWQHSLTRRSIGLMWSHHTGHDKSHSYGTSTREWQLDTHLLCEEISRDDTDVSFKISFKKARERTPETRADFADLAVALVDNAWTYSAATPHPLTKQPSPIGGKFLAALINVPDTVIRDGRRCVAMESWRRECVTLGLIDREAKPDSARTLFSKHRRELVACNVIACNEDYAWKI